MWDDKFGIIEGVGKDAPTITNKEGGKQSSSPYAPYLLDPQFLQDIIGELPDCQLLYLIAEFMKTGDKDCLLQAILFDEDCTKYTRTILLSRLLTISRVLKEGAEKYEANNWRLIPQEHHLSHALTHYFAYLLEDTTDDHLSHFFTRLMMAYATEPSKGFSYTTYLTE